MNPRDGGSGVRLAVGDGCRPAGVDSGDDGSDDGEEGGAECAASGGGGYPPYGANFKVMRRATSNAAESRRVIIPLCVFIPICISAVH